MTAISGYITFILFSLICVVGGLINWDRESKYDKKSK